MFTIQLGLGLIFALTQSSASSETAVSLNCSKTVAVVAGETVTLNCSIEFSDPFSCEGLMFRWEKTRGGNLCDGSKYNCKWDNMTYVSLTILNVEKEENYTIKIDTDCGKAFSTVNVKVIPPPVNISSSVTKGNHHERATIQHVTAALGVIFFICIALGSLYFLFRTGRCRRRPSVHIDVDTPPWRDDLPA